jgi:hypothetical protein
MTVTRGSGYAFFGGSGTNSVDVHTTFAGAHPRATVTLNQRTHGVSTSVGSTGQISGFDTVTLADDVRWGYVGINDPEHLEVAFGGPLRAQMRGGDDVVHGSLTGGDTIDGGDGVDAVYADGTCTHVESGTCG